MVELKSDWAKGYSRLGAAYCGLESYDEVRTHPMILSSACMRALVGFARLD